jgi:exonuclease III
MPRPNPNVDGADDDILEDVVVCPFPKISISSVNCNSLNMSSASSNVHMRKIYGIVKLKTDIIFLSDIRLCNKSGIADLTSLCNTLQINPYCSYKLIHNLRKNSRGVAILYKNSLNINIVQEERDEDDNFLLAKVVINEHTVIVGSIYGPNNTDGRFFERLSNGIANLGNYPIVLGGDWNTTFCSSPLASNIDVINMQSLPNPATSKSLNKLCRDFKLTDPYRILWPERIDYTYIPRDVTKQNRSRIDFFVVSKSIVSKINKCDIMPTVQSKLFDHKAIFINLITIKPAVTIPTISPKIVNDPDLPILVKISVLEIYTRYSAIPSAEQRQVSLGILGRCRRLLREAGPDPVFAGGGGLHVNSDIDQRIRNIDQIRYLLNNFNLNQIQNGEILLPDDDFLEILINDLRNDIISYQTFLLKIQKTFKNF